MVNRIQEPDETEAEFEQRINQQIELDRKFLSAHTRVVCQNPKCGEGFWDSKDNPANGQRCPKCDQRCVECYECSSLFDLPEWIELWEDRFCSKECRIKSNADDWWETVPPLYKETDPDKLPNPTKSAKALEWQDGSQGLWMYGGSGTGKSRTAYLLLKRLAYEGRSVHVVRGQEFGREIVEATRPGGSGDLHEVLSPILRSHVVLFDDAPKIRFSERVESEFWQIVETRMSQQRPMIFTSELGLSEFCKLMEHGNGASIYRRIKEACGACNFDAK
jgi:IstB-like ATP binding protein